MRADAMTRVLDELLWSARREGIEISTVQAIDAARAGHLVGMEDRRIFRDALSSVLTSNRLDARRFERAFDAFFARNRDAADLWQRLTEHGFSQAEQDALRELLDELATSTPDAACLSSLLERGAALEQLLRSTSIARTFDSMQSPMQAGFFAHRAMERIGVTPARNAIASLRARLREAFGERGDALADFLEGELARAADDVRAHVQRNFSRREELRSDRAGDLDSRPFTSLSDREVEETRRAVRAFVERLRGGERVRKRRAARGRIDARATLRRAMATSGVPVQLIRRNERRERARLMLVCDVSDSVRAAARFMLEFVYYAHDLFDKTRSFVFVSELGETTSIFESEPVDTALFRAYGGGVVPVQSNSNYGRVLRDLEERHGRDVDRRTTLVILGDGRTNYHADAVDSLARLKERARAVYWLCPEPRASWAFGDSAMARYAKHATKVIEVTCARELEEAARLISK